MVLFDVYATKVGYSPHTLCEREGTQKLGYIIRLITLTCLILLKISGYFSLLRNCFSYVQQDTKGCAAPLNIENAAKILLEIALNLGD